MKNYKIDFTKNTITISKSFAEKASQMGTPEYAMMLELRKLEMPFHVQQPKRHKKPEYQLTYRKMEKYISCLDEAEGYLTMFRQVKETAKSQNNPYLYVQNWFKATFPNYNEVPELTPDFKVVATPSTTDEAA